MSNDTISVKLCPFCSNDNPETIRIQEIGNTLAVTCLVCGAVGPIADTEDGAIDYWNIRTTAVISQDTYDRLVEEANGQEDS